MFQEFYSKLSEKEKKIFYLAVLFSVLALFDMLFLRPFLSRIHFLDEEIVEKRNALRQDLRFLSYRDKILNEEVALAVFETDESKAEEEIIAGFLKTVELLASEAKINLSKINPADVVRKKGIVEYSAVVECEGRLEDMMSFIHKIDLTKNLLKVVQVDMSGSKTSADNVKISMKVVKLIIDPKSIGNYPYEEVTRDVMARGMGSMSPSANQPKPGLRPAAASRTGGSAARQGGRPSGQAGSAGGVAAEGGVSGGPGGEAPSASGTAPGAQASGAGASGTQESGSTGSGDGGADGSAGEGGTQSAGVSGGGGQSAGAVRSGGGAEGAGSSGRVSGSAITNASGKASGTTGKDRGEDLYLGRDNVGRKRVIKGQQEKAPIEETRPQGNQKGISQSAAAKKAQETLDKVGAGGRVRIESFDSLWERFFGKKNANKESQEEEPVDDEGAGEEGPNYWQRKVISR